MAMVQYIGFTCDECGKVGDLTERTKKTVKFSGPVKAGEFTEDLCPACVVIPAHVKMRPLRTRVTSAVGDLIAAEVAADVPGKLDPPEPSEIVLTS